LFPAAGQAKIEANRFKFVSGRASCPHEAISHHADAAMWPLGNVMLLGDMKTPGKTAILVYSGFWRRVCFVE